jgi:hypothetical protein
LHDHHLTYRPRYATKAAVLATLAAAISLLLAAPARADEPIAGAAAAQQAIEPVRGTLGGDAAVRPDEPVPAGGAVAGERPGAVSDVETAVEPVVRSGQTAVREAVATVKRAQADVEALVDAARREGRVERRKAAAPSRRARASSASVAPQTRPTRVVRSAPAASRSSSTPILVRSRTDGSSLRLRRSDLGAQSGSAAASPGLGAAHPTQQTGPGGAASSSTGFAAGAAAALLAAWLLVGAALRTRVFSSPAASPALGFSSLLERPG